MQAVILAAGKGLRLRPFTEKHPKPLIDINGKPLLVHTLASLPDAVTEVIIVIGYLGEQIEQHFGSTYTRADSKSIPIQYATQTELLGTGDALQRAKTLLHGDFLVVNGDDLYLKSDLEKLIQTPNSMLAWPSQQAGTYGIVKDDNNKILGFDSSSTLINAGAYFLTQQYFEFPLVTVPVVNGVEASLPHTLVSMNKKTDVWVLEAKGWLPVGTPEQLQFANDYFTKRGI